MSRSMIGTYQRNNQIYRTAYYSRVSSAVPRAIGFLMENGHPGDVFELASRDYGFQIAVIKISVGNKISVRWGLQ